MKGVLSRIVAVVCAITFVVSVFLGVTYAWDNEQQAINEIIGTKTKLTEVELIKLEKQDDNSSEEKRIPNTAFYLYKENATQIGERYVTDENGVISVVLPSGKYYFEEVSPAVGYTYDTDTKGNEITKYPFVVTEKDEKVTVKAYNIKAKGDLVISKTVENIDGSALTDVQKKTPFTFTVTFSDSGSYNYSVDGSEEKTLKSGDTLQLLSGQSAVFKDLPFGLLYEVAEQVMSGYTVSCTGHRGNITQKQSLASFINSCDKEALGALTVTKEVTGDKADLEKKFTFTADFGLFCETFTLSHGQEKVFDGIPVGTQYKISELQSENKEYTATVKEYSGTIAKSDKITLPFVNVYTPTTEDEFGSLSVTKNVVGENADYDKQFVFAVKFEGENAPKPEVFSLKSGETKIFENIPQGTYYTVTETNPNGYIPELEVSSGYITSNICSEVTFTNVLPIEPPPDEKAKLTVEKTAGGDWLDDDLQRDFAMTLTLDGEVIEFTLKPYQIIEFTVPVGAEYFVQEADYTAEGFAQMIDNGYGVVSSEGEAVTVTNTPMGEPVVEIKGEKTWNLGGADVKLPQSITVQLKNKDLVLEEKTVKPNAQGEWKYSFIAPKYNSDGTEAEYELYELSIESFDASYNGYNIKNTYVKPLTVQLPLITKVVQGENAPETEFRFLFSGKLNTPMPQDSEGSEKLLTITGSGELSIGEITFTEAGEYTYSLYELNDGEDGWTYDISKYTINISVSKKDNVLTSTCSIFKNDTAVDEIVFTNTFDITDRDNTTTISGKKVWAHGDNPEKSRPTSIIVEVYGDGELAARRKVTAQDEWRYSFELTRYAQDGHEIVYTIDEEPIENYLKSVDGYNLVNTYKKQSTDSGNSQGSSTGSSSSTTPPPTGDNRNFVVWGVVMIVSAAVFTILLFHDKKQKSKRLR